MSRVLIPVDGSELGDRIVSFLDRLPQRRTMEVVLLRVLDDEADRETAVAHLHALADRVRESGSRVVPLFTVGEPGDQIRIVTGLVRPSLVAMSTHGKGGDLETVRGSVAEQVLKECPVPLFLGNPRVLPLDPGTGFARILVPLDSTETSAQILPLVARIARSHQSEVLLLHVEEVSCPAEETEGLLRPFQDRLAQVGVERIRLIARAGEEAAEILDVVEREGVDLLALCSHSTPGPAHRWFGSVAERVVRGCTAPLLVVRVATPQPVGAGVTG